MDKLIETEAGPTNESPRRYRLLAADGSSYESTELGKLGGQSLPENLWQSRMLVRKECLEAGLRQK